MRFNMYTIIVFTLLFLSSTDSLNNENTDRECAKLFKKSVAARSCIVYSNTYMDDGCKIMATCAYRYSDTKAQPRKEDVHRLVNCGGSLEYDRCRSVRHHTLTRWMSS